MSAPPAISSAATASQTAALPVNGLKALLGDFEGKFAQKALALNQFERNKALFSEFQGIRQAWEKRQVHVAEGFNVLRTMRLTTKELCHSDILAWLLDHRLEGFGTHAQGECGFRLFLEELGLPAEFANTSYRVAREVSGKLSRLDILIEAEREFIIGIENKVTSQEILGFEDGEHQTKREWSDLRRRATKLKLPPGRITALFLTPDGQSPRSLDFTPVSWRQVANVFEAFAVEARPPMVKLFAQHYADTIRQDLVTENEDEDEEHE